LSGWRVLRAWKSARRMVQASAQVELGLFLPDIGKRAMPRRQTAREIGSCTMYDPPVRGSDPGEAERVGSPVGVLGLHAT